MRNSLFLILGVLLGASSVWLVKSDSEQVIKEIKVNPSKIPTQFSEKMVSLTQKDYLDYLNLKDEKAKFKKADEVLSKVFLLFMANVGLELSKRSEIQKKMNSHQIEKKSDKKSIQIPEKKENEKQELYSLPSDPEEKLLERGKIDSDEFSKRHLTINFYSKLSKRVPIRKWQLRRLKRNYYGEINFFNNKKYNGPWKIELKFNLKKVKGILRGKWKQMIFDRDGKKIGHFEGEPRQKTLMSAENSSMYILPILHTGGWIELYFPKRREPFGFYYIRKTGTEFPKVARVKLSTIRPN